MICPACEQLLQQRLDGLATGDELARHLEHCPICAEERALVQRFVAAVHRLQPPSPPVELADRLTQGILERLGSHQVIRRRRRVLVGSLLAVAASLLVVINCWPTSPSDQETVEPPIQVAEKPMPPLRNSMAEAQSAVVALTARTANETVETTSHLIPRVSPASLEPFDASSTSIEPSMEPLREATFEVSTAVAPLATSARRAVGLFLRDLPMGRTISDKKPG